MSVKQSLEMRQRIAECVLPHSAGMSLERFNELVTELHALVLKLLEEQETDLEVFVRRVQRSAENV